jgi:hypothetical protein
VGRSFTLFKMMAGVMWSKNYQVTDAEVRELHGAMDRHDGLFYLAAAAGFAADHKAQGDRLDFGRLFKVYRDQFPSLIGGSDEDPFEPLQVDLAEERLSACPHLADADAIDRRTLIVIGDCVQGLFHSENAPARGRAGARQA